MSLSLNDMTISSLYAVQACALSAACAASFYHPGWSNRQKLSTHAERPKLMELSELFAA